VNVQPGQYLVCVGKDAKPVQPHGIKALKDVAILAMQRCAAVLGEKAQDILKAGNDALLSVRPAALVLGFDIDSELDKQFVVVDPKGAVMACIEYDGR
jgi:hypothetical protein